jgi:uncharacterized protein RhaS with RHS repeats
MAETGLSYNMQRDYDPQVGRYVESDPIGLMGGLNTYTYVRDLPVSKIDPTGEDAIVVYGGYRWGWNPFGHVSIAVTGGGLYSFGTGNKCGDLVGQFLLQQANVRNQTVFQIKTSPAQDAQILKYLQQFSQCKTAGKLDNCAYRTQQALQAADIRLNDPILGVPGDTPGSLLQALLTLQAAGQVTAVQIPQGTVPSIDVSSYEQSH